MAGHTTAAAIETVLVIGYGTMGRGVLRSFATHGFTTSICSSRSAEELKDLPPGAYSQLSPAQILTTPPATTQSCVGASSSCTKPAAQAVRCWAR